MLQFTSQLPEMKVTINSLFLQHVNSKKGTGNSRRESYAFV